MWKLSVATLALIAIAACNVQRVQTGQTVHESKSVDAGKFEMARIELQMGAGELKLEGGSEKLIDADFTYNVPAWKPVFESNTASFRADIKIAQPTGVAAVGDAENRWSLRISDKLPMNLVTHLGAGAAEMNLSSVDLENLEVHMGVGKLNLDLRGQPKRDYTVDIKGGVGEATVLLPHGDNVGVSATARGGIGDISVDGLERRDDRWVSAGYDRASVRIHLDVAGGVGDIRLVAR
jgi:N-terminal domain of toast_rack, DUF2154